IPASCVKRVTRSSSSVFGPRTVPKYNASVPCTLSLAVTIGVEQQARTPAAIATDVSSAQSGSVATSRTTTCRPSDAATPHEPERSPSGNCANVSDIAGDKPWEATSLSSPAAAISVLDAAAGELRLELLDEPHDGRQRLLDRRVRRHELEHAPLAV